LGPNALNLGKVGKRGKRRRNEENNKLLNIIRFIAISASLPNWESAFFLDRMRALSGVGGATGPIGTNLDEIRKSPPHVSSSTRGPVLMMRQFSTAAAAVVVDTDSRAAQLQRVETTTTTSVPSTTATMPMPTSTQTEEKTTTTISMQQQQTQPTVDAGGIPSSSGNLSLDQSIIQNS
jgi:hypothetical protein